MIVFGLAEPRRMMDPPDAMVSERPVTLPQDPGRIPTERRNGFAALNAPARPWTRT